jgi:hypothetical protein
VLSPGVRPQDNFLFTPIDDQDHNRFNLLISLIATAQVSLLGIMGFMSRRWRSRSPEAWWTLIGWGTATASLMFSFSFVLYRILPELRFVQLPLRWLLCLNVAFALLTTMAPRPWVYRTLSCLVMLAMLIWVWHRVQPPWWDNSADVAEMLDNQQSNTGYEGTDEYVPTGADAYEINKEAQRVVFEGEGASRIKIAQWAPEFRSFSVNVDHPGKIVLNLFNYPAWEVKINGRPVRAATVEVTGQMILPVEAGENHVRLTFARTADRSAGGLISLAAGVLVLGWSFFNRRIPGFPEKI